MPREIGVANDRSQAISIGPRKGVDCRNRRQHVVELGFGNRPVPIEQHPGEIWHEDAHVLTIHTGA